MEIMILIGVSVPRKVRNSEGELLFVFNFKYILYIPAYYEIFSRTLSSKYVQSFFFFYCNNVPPCRTVNYMKIGVKKGVWISITLILFCLLTCE